MFDRLNRCGFEEPGKRTDFSVAERVDMPPRSHEERDCVEGPSFEGCWWIRPGIRGAGVDSPRIRGHLRLRVRTSDGADESQAGAAPGNRLHAAGEHKVT